MKNFKLLSLFILFCGIAKAQQNFTLYNMPSIPQSNLLNPALVPDCKWHIGVPAMNSTYLHFTNGAFNLNKVFDAMEPINADTNVLNLNKILDVLSKNNYIAVKSEISWLSGGFKLLKKHYFHLSVQEKVQFRMSIPKDLLRFIIDGNGGSNLGETFNFDFKTSAIHYREYAIGYALNFSDKLTFGGRIKYLQGMNILETKSANINITTDPNDFSYLVGANLNVRMASSLGKFISTDSNQTFDPQPSNFFKTQNTGIAFDLGAKYKVTDKLSVNASILDMGFIHWKQNTISIRSRNPNAKYRFDGVHIKSSDTNTDFNQYFQNVGDSLLKIFKVDTFQNQSFNSGLSAEFFIGANYQMSKRWIAGALFYGDFYNKRFYPALTLNANYKLGKALSLNVSNTMYNRSFLNVGLGASVNAGAFQIYSVMDNVLFPIMITTSRTFSWRFGMNVTFGRKRLNPKNGGTNSNGDPAGTDPSKL